MKTETQEFAVSPKEDSGAMHRFNISSHIRAAENEMDEMHGKWILSQKSVVDLTRQLAVAKAEIEDLKVRIEAVTVLPPKAK